MVGSKDGSVGKVVARDGSAVNVSVELIVVSAEAVSAAVVVSAKSDCCAVPSVCSGVG